jgi:hypothetical protein
MLELELFGKSYVMGTVHLVRRRISFVKRFSEEKI